MYKDWGGELEMRLKGINTAVYPGLSPCGRNGFYSRDEGRPALGVGGGQGDIIQFVFQKDGPPCPQLKGVRSAVGKDQD